MKPTTQESSSSKTGQNLRSPNITRKKTLEGATNKQSKLEFPQFAGLFPSRSHGFETYLMSDKGNKRIIRFLSNNKSQSSTPVNPPSSLHGSIHEPDVLRSSHVTTPFSKTGHRKSTSDLGSLAKLTKRLSPHIETFKVKKLKSSTLLLPSVSPKGTISFNVNENSPIIGTRSKFLKDREILAQSSDQHLLGTENTLSDLYSQSLKIQQLLRIKDDKILEKKLNKINQIIQQEQTRLSKGFYSL